MYVMRRTAKEAEATKESLLEAALLLFGTKGWRGTTFEAIAQRAGVTRGALHHHFASKQTLLREALEWGWQTYGDRLFAAMGDRDLHSQLTRLLTAYIQLLQEDERFLALAATSVVVAPQAFDELEVDEGDGGLDAWHAKLTLLIKNQRPVFASTPPKVTAGLVIVLIQGFTVAAVTRPQDLPEGNDLHQAMYALVSGLLH